MNECIMLLMAIYKTINNAESNLLINVGEFQIKTINTFKGIKD